ncbi:hypothetical protein HMPREF2983_07780 [Prevotella sp. HMSC077E09]|nr:hypothetical protein HMPREF3018_08170 [Prevotella sp. HMSC077E08]OFP56884.1 hypothetical protein HMPREF2983_07780 [Prevotella sp. HMSC077E09]
MFPYVMQKQFHDNLVALYVLKNIANERKVNDFIICRVQLYFLQKYKKTDKTIDFSTDYASNTYKISR